MSSNRKPTRKPIAFTDSFFHQQQSFGHDDDTVLRSNVQLQPLIGIQNRNQQQEQPKQVEQKHLDKKRAPKLAALLFTIFFIFGGSYYLIHDVKGNSRGETLKILQDENNETEAIILGTVSISDLIEEMSQPNLDANLHPIRLPPELANLAEMNMPLEQKHEVPIFWHIPRSGGSSIKQIATYCFDLTLASEIGPLMDPDAGVQNHLMTVVDTKSGAKYLNVDTTSPNGLERARDFNVASSQDLDLIVTPYIFLASDVLFNAINRGRFIAFFRHPIDRAASMFYYLRDKAGIRGAQIGESLDLYAKSSMVENNWMTRFLTNKMGGELSPEDEAMAKEVLRTKCLVGLLSKKTESMRRFKTYFQWNNNKHENQDCEDKLLHWGWSGKNKHESVEEGTETWNLLKEQNTFDIRLYEYAVKLFEVQGSTIFSE
jgi:hypothetical protein